MIGVSVPEHLLVVLLRTLQLDTTLDFALRSIFFIIFHMLYFGSIKIPSKRTPYRLNCLTHNVHLISFSLTQFLLYK